MPTRKQRVEALAITIAEAVLAGQRVEGTYYECKSDWPAMSDSGKSAWQIGALANAALAESVYVVIGLDEDAGTFGTLTSTDIGTWWQAVQARFDAVAPDLLTSVALPSLEVSGQTGSVVILEFGTDRAPYVVKNPPSRDRGVPWRDGASSLAATHYQLSKLMFAGAPRIAADVQSGDVLVDVKDDRVRVIMDVDVILLPEPGAHILIHGDRATVEGRLFEADKQFMAVTADKVVGMGAAGGSITMHENLIVEVQGPGVLALRATAYSEPAGPEFGLGDVPIRTSSVTTRWELDLPGTDKRLLLEFAAKDAGEVMDRGGRRRLVHRHTPTAWESP